MGRRGRGVEVGVRGLEGGEEVWRWGKEVWRRMVGGKEVWRRMEMVGGERQGTYVNLCEARVTYSSPGRLGKRGIIQLLLKGALC